MALGNSSTSPEGLVPQVENATYHSTKLEKSTLKFLALATSQKLLTEVPTCSILALPTMFGRWPIGLENVFLPVQVLTHFSSLLWGPWGAALPLCAWAQASPWLGKAARGRSSWIHQQPCRRANWASVWSGGHSEPHPPRSSWLAPGGDGAYALHILSCDFIAPI